ncbi:hypothetical protein [Chlorogloeopsis sp. ULAP02]|uniref:hypothetical protein n=1 Tax=Chlorogloeopsis sp. ULAP02 TaxID=3107926 RepID=UPI00313545F9
MGSLLDQSWIGFFLERINDIKRSFYVAFNQLTSKAEMITLSPGIFQESLNRTILEKHVIDKVILECIINHALFHPNDIKVFLSNNSKEFAQREVIKILQDAGIQYFQQTQNFLGCKLSKINSLYRF